MLSSIASVGRWSLAGFLILAGTFSLVTESAAADLVVGSAVWDPARSNLDVRGTGDAGATITVRNAFDTDRVLETKTIRGNGTWRTQIRRPAPVPCRVLAEYEPPAPEQPSVMDVQGAPPDCAPKGPVNLPPTANANGPYSGPVGSAVSFSSAGSSDPDGSIVSYSWDFGDSTNSSQPNPTHTYASSGTRTVILTVTDNDGASDSDSTTASISPGNAPPIANANGPYSGTVDSAVSFSSAGSSDPDGSIVSYSWDFGDGTNSSQPNPSHTYASSGARTVTLTVTDNDGASDSDSTTASISAGNAPPIANANGPYSGTVGSAVSFSSAGSSDPDGSIDSYSWDFGDGSNSSQPNPSHTYTSSGTRTVILTVTDNEGAGDSDSTTATITASSACPDFDPSAVPEASINSTSQSSECQSTNVVSAQDPVPNTDYSVLAINDLGMHCGDYDTRIASILPPFQVLLAQVIQKGAQPTLNPDGVDVFYSATSNPNDPNGGTLSPLPGVMDDGSTYKTNFWDTVAMGAYDAFYPGGMGITPLDTGTYPTTSDRGLPVPNLEELYIGADGVVDQDCDQPGANCDGMLVATQHAMPGMTDPYVANVPQKAQEHFEDKPFFVNFPFGYVADKVDWYEGAGVPFSAFDDFGRENPYPLVRVQARNAGSVLSTVDTVLPISGEASCTNCHTTNADYTSVHGAANRTDIPTNQLTDANLPVVTSLDDPDINLPPKVSLEYAADVNILRLHDLKHGAAYVTPTGDGVASATPCDIHANGGNGDAACLTNKALLQGEPEPVVCQVCHYTPALDLAHAGPLTGLKGSTANGRNQQAHQSNSRVMHNHHGTIEDLDRDGNAMFPAIEPPNQSATGAITNQADRLAQLEDSCYQCHPGKTTQCLRGAMFNADMLCSDCHGSMEQVGNDFSKNVSPSNAGLDKLILDGNFYDPADPQPRVPWANEPGCGSCHTGDTNSNLAGTPGTRVNSVDTYDNADGIRLRQAFRDEDVKATPIVPTNKRFAEPAVPASFNGFANPGAGNPKLYRVSTGHGGVFCEGCHGATHAEWPNANPSANDNLTAMQLQGHTGTLIECGSCHGTGWEPSSGQALGGPHGMHVVGDTNFSNGGHEQIADNNSQACFACHGGTSRGNSEGTVLSRAAKNRTLHREGGTVPVTKGEPVGCALCHGGSED